MTRGKEKLLGVQHNVNFYSHQEFFLQQRMAEEGKGANEVIRDALKAYKFLYDNNQAMLRTALGR